MKFVDDDPSRVLCPSSDVRKLHDLFNASAASRRTFSEVHYYKPEDPDLTIGMGHWIRKNITDLFVKLRADKETWEFCMNTWAGTLSEEHWRQLEDEIPMTTKDKIGLESALRQILCLDRQTKSCVRSVLEPWADEVGENFNSTDHWFTAGWKVIARAEPVAKAQVEHWVASVLEPGSSAAEDRDLSTKGGVACVISSKSSGLRATMFDAGDTEVSAKGRGVVRRWSLVSVPEEALPPESASENSERLLQDWRAVVAWQYYTVKKKRVRSRMREIWGEFFAGTWGNLKNPSSLSESTKVPRHLGRHMENKAFDFTVIFS